jgi:hypothetical protein
MWQALGIDLSLWARVFIGGAFFVVLILGAGFAVRRFGGRALGATGTRGRQPRLAVIDTTMVDSRRTLLLIRRDNVEHLIMTGGPTDVVIESNIVRGVPAVGAREAAPSRVTPTLADTLPRAVPLADGGNRPPQPDMPPLRAEPPVRAEPPMRAEAPMRGEAPRPQRAAPPPPPAPPPPAAFDLDAAAQEPDWSAPEEPAIESEPPPRIEPRAEPMLRAEPPLRAEPMLRAVPDPEPSERPQRAARMQNPERNPERLAGLAADLSRSFMDTDLSAQPRRAAEPRRPPPPPVQPVPSVPPLSEAEEQNLTEMAQRLESALQRPRPSPIAAAEPAPPTPPAPPAPPTLRAVELPRIEPVARTEAKPPRPEIVPVPAPAAKPAAKAAPSAMTRPTTAKPALGTLEQEMASLLGRSSSGKT